MKRLLFFLLLLPAFVNGQIGAALDSATFTFLNTDSLHHTVHYAFFGGITSVVSIDTSLSMPWQIGSTLKPVFSNDTVRIHGIMTDTSHSYPANANAYFTLKFDSLINIAVNFWHKYETDSLHAGGIVEFSTDSGISWMNIANCPSMVIQNFYASTDTLLTGQPAFTGTSHGGERLSSFFFLNCEGVRVTSTTCFPDLSYWGPISIRFRFISDSTPSSLSGWMIDSIKLVINDCVGEVHKIGHDYNFSISPNPATSTLNIASPELINNITVTNLLGQTVLRNSYNDYQIDLDISILPSGMYFIMVNDAVRKFVKE